MWCEAGQPQTCTLHPNPQTPDQIADMAYDYANLTNDVGSTPSIDLPELGKNLTRRRTLSPLGKHASPQLGSGYLHTMYPLPILHPSPYTLRPKPEPRDPKHETRSKKSETRIKQPSQESRHSAPFNLKSTPCFPFQVLGLPECICARHPCC